MSIQKHRPRSPSNACHLAQCLSIMKRARALEVVMIRISIASPQDVVAIDRVSMRRAAITVLEGEDIHDAEVSLAFVDNPTIHQLNKRYLQHDEPTDVLSFPLSEPNARRLAGELVIGAEMAKVQAENRGHPVEAELALYVIHGLLHVYGYDHNKPADAAAMHQR